jgi:hypothetical protein
MVLNTVDADTAARSIHVIKPGGVLVSVAGAAPADACAQARIRCEATGRVTGEMLGSVSQLAGEGMLAVRIERRLSLEEVGQGWDLGRQGHTGGKMIIEVGR